MERQQFVPIAQARPAHIQYIPIVEIDGIAVLGVIFHTRAGTAEERMLMCAVELRKGAPGGLEVGQHATVRILGREDAVEQCTFVIVGVGGRWLLGEQGLRQAQHIVGATGFHGLGRGQMLFDLGGRKEMLAVAMSPRRK
ncbi:hypothetical protein ASC93_13640 [Massilia sp. Root335]|nr:hypothetical protein ASC93_13640 [Massilia sp. Root335]